MTVYQWEESSFEARKKLIDMNSISSYIVSEQENNLSKKESISEIPSVK